MVNITIDREPKLYKLGDLPQGHFFLYENEVYVKIDFNKVYNFNATKVFSLNTTTFVEPMDAKIRVAPVNGFISIKSNC